MADTQNVIYAQAFGTNIMQLAQQKYSKLLPTVYLKPDVKGKVFFQDQIGAWSMAVKGGRNVDTPNNDPNLSRRRGTMVDYHDNRMLDRGDELRTISDPRSSYTLAAAGSIGRQVDDIIIAAALGSADSGETGSTSVTQGNIVLATAASMTLERIAAVKKKFDDEDVEAEDRVFVCNNTVIASMLNLATVTSSDYNTIKALVRGEIDTWMGFKWIWTNRLSSYSSSTIALAYQRYGMCAAMLAQPIVRTDERADKSYSWQVYYEVNAGAVRLEEDRVVVINEG